MLPSSDPLPEATTVLPDKVPQVPISRPLPVPSIAFEAAAAVFVEDRVSFVESRNVPVILSIFFKSI
jgi:hypothetical protein